MRTRLWIPTGFKSLLSKGLIIFGLLFTPEANSSSKSDSNVFCARREATKARKKAGKKARKGFKNQLLVVITAFKRKR
jgi:hypothetical protein